MPQAIFDEGEFTSFRRSDVGFNARTLSDIVYQRSPKSTTNLSDNQKVAVFDLMMKYFADPSTYQTRDITMTLHPTFVKQGERRKDGKALADALLEGLVREPLSFFIPPFFF